MATIAILPIKSFGQAKQRLREQLAPTHRRRLAEAMYRDVLVALGHTEAIAQILVVTSDQRARELAVGPRTLLLDDQGLGHSEAAVLGARAGLESGFERTLLVPGDCPLLDPDELDALLARDAAARSALIVPDRHGTGTNALLLRPPDALAPAFGPGSCRRHVQSARAAGSAAEVVTVSSLALDIDTPDDLEALIGAFERSGDVAIHTRAALGELLRSPA
ncbi:MAG: 2-phospho-L-lactate guanylyltransferase [Solirubrobacterales bacterium]|nr:2-phospho-L-lactate guanylyltransferase [Solirubrobacterales bacterium]